MNEHFLDTIELELAILIRRITAKKTGGLERSAYLLLHQINSHGAAGVKALAEEFDLDISTVSRQAAALEKNGYVYRVPDPVDGRAYSFQITDIGIKELLEEKQNRKARVGEVVKYWSDEEKQVFGELLKKFNIAVTNKR
ncbi:MarR family winged helix-turn-helix transcriptional regulator [Neobacillus niacini]|uniref:MarR family winged helix-turn-helix transcriptional regulator n=1 Tax=Neobacillus niacini TaxID=86668 RepID=UPI0005EEB18A|nr:MarR family transcriptional regulator [Neobacillus niacini]